MVTWPYLNPANMATTRNGSASGRKGPTPRKDEHTGKSVVTNAIPRIVFRKCVTQEPFPFKVGYSHKQMTLVLLSFLLVSGRFGPPGACPAASDRRALLYVQLPQSAYQNW